MKVNLDYEVPYIGGYSKDGQTIYIDRNYPKNFKDLSGKIHNAHHPLIIHEMAEAVLMCALSFEDAHHRALEYEIAGLRSAGIPIDEYYGFLYKYVRKNVRKVRAAYAFELPPDLDMRPYASDNLVIWRLEDI